MNPALHILIGASLGISAGIAGLSAQAAEYPTKPIRLVVGFPSTPAEFSAYLKNEIAKWAKVAKEAGARVE